MPPRTKSKPQNQAKKEEISPIAQQIKSAITPSIPIEQVVYLNDNKSVIHEQGSNRYYINYPDTWRTISNQQLVLGVRAIRKFWDKILMKISMNIEVFEVSHKIWTFVFQTSMRPDDMSNGNEKEFVARINEQWTGWLNELSETDRAYFTDFLNRSWTVEYDGDRYIIRTPHLESEEFSAPYTIRFGTIIMVSPDMRMYFNIEPYVFINPITEKECLGQTFASRNNAFRYFNDRYILAASFASQTNYRYIGFTNTEFNPPKQYIIPNGDTQFWIDVVTADGRGEVELDSRDLVVIEFQLTTIPLQKYV